MQQTSPNQDKIRSQKQKNRSIYLLPNLVTTGALLAGFSSVLSSVNDQFERAAIYIFIAMLLDGLDGRVARLTNTSSAFGEQYDSLSDLLSFGVAPAILMYQWSLNTIDTISWLPSKLSWMVPFIYCACAALRLARFNVQIGSTNPKYFIGLPSPSAAGTVAGFVWFGVEFSINASNVLALCFFITFCAGILMVSPIKYFSFKKIDLTGKVPLLFMGGVVLVLAIISINPATVLWLIFTGFACSGPLRNLLVYFKDKRSKSNHQ